MIPTYLENCDTNLPGKLRYRLHKIRALVELGRTPYCFTTQNHEVPPQTQIVLIDHPTAASDGGSGQGTWIRYAGFDQRVEFLKPVRAGGIIYIICILYNKVE